MFFINSFLFNEKLKLAQKIHRLELQKKIVRLKSKKD